MRTLAGLKGIASRRIWRVSLCLYVTPTAQGRVGLWIKGRENRSPGAVREAGKWMTIIPIGYGGSCWCWLTMLIVMIIITIIPIRTHITFILQDRSYIDTFFFQVGWALGTLLGVQLFKHSGRNVLMTFFFVQARFCTTYCYMPD